MKTPSSSEPHKLCLIRVQLEPIGRHPVCNRFQTRRNTAAGVGRRQMVHMYRKSEYLRHKGPGTVTGSAAG